MNDIDELVEERIRSVTSESEYWRIVVVTITWLFMGVGVGWARWRRWQQPAADCIHGLLLKSVRQNSSGHQPMSSELSECDVEDDGSPEWQRLADLISLCTAGVKGMAARELAEKSIRLVLEGEFSRLGNIEADRLGRSIFEPEAERLVSTSSEWRAIQGFVRSL